VRLLDRSYYLLGQYNYYNYLLLNIYLINHKFEEVALSPTEVPEGWLNIKGIKTLAIMP
jgi:hypothetical protein